MFQSGQRVGQIMIRRYELPRWQVTPEPAIWLRFARTRWACNPPYGSESRVRDSTYRLRSITH
jgi:hypothetical protein